MWKICLKTWWWYEKYHYNEIEKFLIFSGKKKYEHVFVAKPPYKEIEFLIS
jgi:hypothetical protein